jgi:hypothetical protein
MTDRFFAMTRIGLCGLVVFAVGCKSTATAGAEPSDAGEDAGPLALHAPTDAANAACQDSARALCARAAGCAATYMQFVFGSVAQCEKQVTAACNARYIGPGAAESPQSCATAASAVPCEEIADLENMFFEQPLIASCPVTPGRFADGDACRADGDCQSGYCLSQIDCRTTPCVAGCGRCTPRSDAGGPCSGNHGCNAGLRCVAGGGGDPPGRCRRFPHVGEPCGAAAGQCAGGGYTTYCDATTSICMQFATSGAGQEGASCYTPEDCFIAQGFGCSAAKTCTKQNIAALGSSCSDKAGPFGAAPETFCDANGRCIGGTCALWPHLDEACDAKASPATAPCSTALRCDPNTSRCVVDVYTASACDSR